jgi:spermidine synthase
VLLRSLIILLCCVAARAAGAQVLHQEKSLYRDIVVYEENGLRCMKFGYFNVQPQTCMYVLDPAELAFPYSRMLIGALYLKPAPRRVLLVGLGGGTLATALKTALPSAQIDCVELDPAVVQVARKYFGFKPERFSSVVVDDGRVFVKRAARQGKKYDMIFLDAFDQAYIPEHMMTREYFAEVKSILADDGVLGANSHTGSKLYDAESATYAAVFGSYFNLVHLNRIVLFRNNGLPAIAELQANAEHLAGRLQSIGVDKGWLLPLFTTDVHWPDGTRILTDQYSPANLLNGPR